MKRMNHELKWTILGCWMGVMLILSSASLAVAAPKLTAEGAKKHFGDVNAPQQIDTGFEKEMLLP